MVINPIVGVYIPIVRIPIKGGMTIPNIATFDHGTYKIHYSSDISPGTPGEVTVSMKSMATSREKLQKSLPGVAKRAGRSRRQVPHCGTSWRGGAQD